MFDQLAVQLEALPPDLQEEARAKLARLQVAAKGNPLWGYVPHGKQQRYHGITAMIGAFAGGNRSGKSTGGTNDDLIQCCDAEVLPPWLLPYKRWHHPVEWRVITPNLTTTLEGVVLPLFKKWTPKSQLFKGSWDRAYNQRLRKLQFANGSTIDFLTHDMDLDAFSGAALHGVRCDEEPKGHKGRQIYEESLMRVLDYGGDFRMTFTPLFGLSWAYHELTRRGEPRWDDEVQVVTVDMDDNPHLDEQQKERVLARYSDVQREARKSGRFIHFAGVIYPEWDPDVHVVPSDDVPFDDGGAPLVHAYQAIDPGRDHPAGYVWAWVDDEDLLVVYDRMKLRGATVEEAAAEILAREAKHGITPRWRVIDPSARNKSHATGRSIQDEYRKHKIHTIPGQNSRLAGYNRVSERLKKGRGPGGLVVMAHCSNPDDPDLPALIEEFPEYRWKSATKGESAGREEPIKVKDDELDALRYLVMSNPRGPRTPDPEDQPPENAADYERWERSQMLKGHLKRVMKGRRSRRVGAVR